MSSDCLSCIDTIERNLDLMSRKIKNFERMLKNFPTNNFNLATQVWPAIVELQSTFNQDFVSWKILNTQMYQMDERVKRIVLESATHKLGPLRTSIRDVSSGLKKVQDEKTDSVAVDEDLSNVMAYLINPKESDQQPKKQYN